MFTPHARAGDSKITAKEILAKMVQAMGRLNYEGTVVFFRNGKVETMKYVHAARQSRRQQNHRQRNIGEDGSGDGAAQLRRNGRFFQERQGRNDEICSRRTPEPETAKSPPKKYWRRWFRRWGGSTTKERSFFSGTARSKR